MKDVDLTGIHYIGVDIVRELITMNQNKYANTAREFQHLNIVKDSLPKVDVIFCRDCLVHLSNRKVQRVLENIKKSQSTYLITTTFPEILINEHIVTGQFRPLNLQESPFNPRSLQRNNSPELALGFNTIYFSPTGKAYHRK